MSGRRCAILGKPVAHSLSPVLHRAAFTTLGLTGWTYDAIECDDLELPGLVAGLDPSWIGLSVTMPGKVAALEFAATVTDRAVLVGAANTLVRQDSGWTADCTDVDGVAGALRGAGFVAATGTAVLLGAGGTARAALAALAALGVTDVQLVVRSPERARTTVECAGRVGLHCEVVDWSSPALAEMCAAAEAAVSTVPAAASEPVAAAVAGAAVVLDAGYHPWPTPIAAAVQCRGGRLASGLDMLLHQAFGQVEQFTGQAAPREAMRDALYDVTGYRVALT